MASTDASPVRCKDCDATTHKTRRHRLCPLNVNNRYSGQLVLALSAPSSSSNNNCFQPVSARSIVVSSQISSASHQLSAPSTESQVQNLRITEANFNASSSTQVIPTTIVQQSHFSQIPPLNQQQVTEVNSGSTAPLSLSTANTTVSEVGMHDIGLMDKECPFCHALFWVQEKSSGSISSPKFTMCCNKGTITIDNFQRTPEVLASLLKGQHPLSNEFKQNIRMYNTALSFTSLGANLDHNVANNNVGAYCFRIQGSIYHRIGSLYPQSKADPPLFSQVYIYDADEQLSHRLRSNNSLNRDLLQLLQTLLLPMNPFIRKFRHMHELIQETGNVNNVNLVFKAESKTPDRRRYNRPTISEVAVLIVDSNTQTSGRDIVVRARNNGELQKMNELNQNYDPLQYVLMFPDGQTGWNISIRKANEVPTDPPENDDDENAIEDDAEVLDEAAAAEAAMESDDPKKITVMKYYAYRLMYRVNDNGGNHIHLYGRLFQQYVVDMYAKLEQSRLNYFRFNQSRIRSELYSNLTDAIRSDDTNMANVGRMIVLPSSDIGSPRSYQQFYQDALEITRRTGGPHLFITMTCNPNWEEIQRELKYGQTATDRPDLVVRVFNLKLKALLSDLIDKKVLGKVIGQVYTIEYQKRGLPHCHILLMLAADDVPRTPEEVDRLISAEIPNPLTHPKAYATVTKLMMHTKCNGAITPNSNIRCINEKGKCSKQFPKKLRNDTNMDINGYPEYRRRNLRQFVKNGVTYTDEWVVPHNLWLCAKYNSHINVEMCASVKAIKYLYKYVYKGHDRAEVELQQSEGDNVVRDEIRNYLDARYISPTEACWRLFGFKIHSEKPTIIRLDIHLENEQPVVFNEGATPQQVANRAITNTKLTAWFNYNAEAEQKGDNLARTLLYSDFPMRYTFNASTKLWKLRQRGVDNTFGRMYVISASQTEKYFLRMLLTKRPGSKSFTDLRTVGSDVYATYRETAVALGLLASDDEFSHCIEEAITHSMPNQLRNLFAMLIIFCDPASPHELWMSYRASFVEDYLHQHNRHLNIADRLTEPTDQMYNMALFDIEDELAVHQKSLASIPGFTLPEADPRQAINRLPDEFNTSRTMREHGLMIQSALDSAPVNVEAFNASQRQVFDTLIEASNSSNTRARLYFLDAPGGTRKTFLFSSIIKYIRQHNGVSIAVASSGTAATLLPGGRTAHSTFKIPLVVTAQTACTIKPRSTTAELIKKAKIIVWDEASMIDLAVFEFIDRNFRDIMKEVDARLRDVPFGGILMVFGGDFRQVLPVVPSATRGQVVSHCINRSQLWRHAQILSLTVNMRVEQARVSNDLTLATELSDFAAYLLRIGGGVPENIQGVTSPDFIRLPTNMVLPNDNLLPLINFVFPTFTQQALTDGAILAPTNLEVDRINRIILEENFPGDIVDMFSIDTHSNPEDSTRFTPEYLNSINYSGLPPHSLRLKIGCPIMLLRNLNPSKGLCNGKRLVLDAIQPRVLRATILTGSHIGDTVLIPKIFIFSDENNSPVNFKRYQFPVRPAFAMTINKSQGQTLNKVGISLSQHVFSHGQLYVALSRAKQASAIKVSINPRVFKIFNQPNTDPSRYTKNVVFTEVYQSPFTRSNMPTTSAASSSSSANSSSSMSAPSSVSILNPSA